MATENKGARKKRTVKTAIQPNKRRSPTSPISRKSTEPSSIQTEATDYQRGAKKLFWVRIFREWCKSCGICEALCPQNIIAMDDHGFPRVEKMDECTGCRNCEIHCPDFAITIKKRHPERRKNDGTR